MTDLNHNTQLERASAHVEGALTPTVLIAFLVAVAAFAAVLL